MKLVLLVLIIIVDQSLFGVKANGLTAEGIVGGKFAKFDNFSYQVSIQISGMHVCGGAIIESEFVASSAHCIFHAHDGKIVREPITVVAGSLNAINLSNTSVTVKVVDAYILKSYVSPHFLPRKKVYATSDLVILKVKPEFDLTAKSKLKKLKRLRKGISKFSKYPIIAGQGYNTISIIESESRMKRHGISDGYLRFAEARVLDNEDCSQRYNMVIKQGDFCAKIFQDDVKKVQGTCVYDSGSPLVYNGYLFIGVLSGGPFHCNETRIPGVYTSVSYHSKFINNALEGKVTSDMRHIIYTKDSIIVE